MLMLLEILFLAGSQGAQPLTADLLVTNQPGTAFLRSEKGERVELASVKTARRGEPIGALVLFSGCAPDKYGGCNVRMDIALLDPTGKVYGEAKDQEIWVDKPPPSAGTTQLGVGYLMIRIEPKDPPGKYRVKAHLTDHNAKADVDLEWSFEVPPNKQTDSAEWPADKAKPDLTGFWKDHCEDGHGLKIEPAGGDLYSISFCGPGGCFEPGTYRPNSKIFGDESYRVIDASTLEVLGGDGFSTYFRCATSAPQ
jgi:hypothetical protein